MKARRLKFKKLNSSSPVVSFKGFVVKNNNTILSTDYAVTKSQTTLSGTLEQLIIKDGVDFLSLSDLQFSTTNAIRKDFEIDVEFVTEIDFDLIQCVGGSNKNNHLTSIQIYYQGNTGGWTLYNKVNTVPEYAVNGIGNSIEFIADVIQIKNISNYFKNNLVSNVSDFQYIHKSFNSFKTGKHFIEVSFLNIGVRPSSPFLNCIGIHEVDTPFVFFNNNAGRKGYFVSYITGAPAASGIELVKSIGTNTTQQVKIGTGYPSNIVWPEITIGFLVDLDNSRLKIVYNGSTESSWITLTKTKPDQEFVFFTEFRGIGVGMEFTLNHQPKYTYPDLTADYRRDHFALPVGWIKKEAVVLKKPFKAYIDAPHTYARRGILNIGVPFHKTIPSYYARTDGDTDNSNSYGYFKNTVFIDYPPKEPISKKVQLFSISDNKVIQQVWSDALTGQYEFKYIRMNQAYLIYTFDHNEDYNAQIIGPVYPELMPEFVGKV